jgi:Cysteine-rich secretory protein family
MLANLRLLVSAILLFAAALLPSALRAATAASRSQPNTPEAILFNAANRDRATAGLPAFHWDANLAEAARLHAERMAQHNTLSHQFPGEAALQDRAQQAGARFSMIAENIAEGPSPQGLHTQWMNSAPHRANLLDRQLNSIGIAVVQRGNVFFAAEDFAVTVPHLSFEEQEAQVRAQLADYGLRLESDAADARKTCAMDRGFAGAKPALVLRYEMADLNQLPEEVGQRARSGKFHSAAVGACEASGAGTFTRFRIAIVFY